MAARKTNLTHLRPDNEQQIGCHNSGETKDAFCSSSIEYLLNARPFGSPKLHISSTSIITPSFRWAT